ncbi:formin-like protein 3 [Panicum miliaceum]|uniref:Formin-like protein 3 n=1 Tax=Panicum miliaceum TaxID=4540 RepID=A0A3L6RTI0_PANMI|nr:formin-like protein 3 [Panicum miliaceum]
MAATACAYGYQQQGTRPPPPPLALAAPARSSSQVPDPFLVGFDDDDAELTPPPPPPPPLPRPCNKAPPSFLSRHLGICTEGLGSESSGDIDLNDLSDDVNNADDEVGQALVVPCKRQHRDGGGEGLGRRARGGRPAPFPPPISVIGAGGKPWLYLRPHREDGRLVLREVRIPTRELLQARREGGRFKLQFAQPLPEEEEPEDVHHHHHQCQDHEPADEKRQEGNE